MENNIYTALIGVMSEVGAIEKNSYNSQQKFKYRGVEAVMNTLQPLFIKYGIVAIPCVIDQHRETRQTGSGGTLLYSILTVRYDFFASDGSSVSAVVVGEGMDSGDKASNKAMSVAFKYACFQVLCIPTEETALDPDAYTPEQTVGTVPTQRPESSPAPAQPNKEEQTQTNTYTCANCGCAVDENMAERTQKAFGTVLCKDCGLKKSKKQNR